MFGLQPWHLLVILAVALIIFGPSRLPEVGRAIGQSINEFREAATGAERQINKGLEKPTSESDRAETDAQTHA
jgi:sec-independent protein translocase protein TatA